MTFSPSMNMLSHCLFISTKRQVFVEIDVLLLTSRRTMSVYTAKIKIQLSTLLSNVCMFTKLFSQEVLNSFNQLKACQISPTTEETLFCITASSHDIAIIRKFNYTTLFMRHYIYSSKLNSLAISIQDFISKLHIK